MFNHIIDDDLELRLFTMRDAETLFTLIDNNRDHLREWFPWVDRTKSVEDVKKFLSMSLDQFKEDKGFQAGIWYKNELAGLIGTYLTNWEDKHTSIGYWLGKDYQGKGMITRSCKAIINHVFHQLELRRVEIRCAEGNHKSRAIPERLGFTNEGMLRNIENLYGEYVNHIIYGLLVEEWAD